MYPNVIAAATQIVAAVGPRGLYTGYVPTLLEDVPDMAVKFACYETVRRLHRTLTGRNTQVYEDLAYGGASGAIAAAVSTPLDVIKTRMVRAGKGGLRLLGLDQGRGRGRGQGRTRCEAASLLTSPSSLPDVPSPLARQMTNAASRPTVTGAFQQIMRESGHKGFLRGIGPRALSNGINSAIFFFFFEAIRGVQKRAWQSKLKAQAAERSAEGVTGHLFLPSRRRLLFRKGTAVQ